MMGYVVRRVLLMGPTLLGILLINFIIIQAAPGGPVEQLVVQLTSPAGSGAAGRMGAAGDLGGGASVASAQSAYRGAQGIDPELLAEINKQFGFDKPPVERFWLMLKQYARFDFGTSFFRDTPVLTLIKDKLPVSISLGLWTTLILYLVSIPLGIRKAVEDGTQFDVWSSTVVVVGQAIPGFLFAVLLLILFAGGSYVQWFPLRGIVSDGWASMPWGMKILDYLWHMVLPVTAMVIGGFASLTLLTKNSFIEEISKQYVMTARAKGLSERKVLYGHVFRNAMLIVIASFPAVFISIFFGGSLIIETIFSLDGLGRLAYESAIQRDYPVVFGTLYVFGLLGLIVGLLSDLTYVWIDPRIDFESRET